MHDEDKDRYPASDAIPQNPESQAAPRIVPCNDARGGVLPITPEEQARNPRAIAAFIQEMKAMPDDDPPGAWFGPQ
jgi:hypothetical protein